jgi:chromate transporter
MPVATPLTEVAGTFLRLGCISFGGPIAHLGYLRAEAVEKRKWLEDSEFADLVALCQFLPGPASSQVVFALGMRRAGLAGALLASVCFSLPSALLMIGFAYGMASLGSFRDDGLLHGLRLAAVVVVAQAVYGMGRKLCTDRVRMSLCLSAAAVLLVAPGTAAQLATIAAGGAIGFWRYRTASSIHVLDREREGRGRVFGAAALALCFALLLVLPALSLALGTRDLAEFDSFYRAGSLVFGGGHVVLPLLRSELVPRGWLSDDEFLAGYGAAQALPGPLFTFAAYLGAAMHQGSGRWVHGLWCLVAILLPGWLLIGGALPFWESLRTKASAQAAMAGANATVVGILLAALYDPVISEGVRNSKDVAAALVAFGLLEHWKWPPWLVVGSLAAIGPRLL